MDNGVDVNVTACQTANVRPVHLVLIKRPGPTPVREHCTGQQFWTGTPRANPQSFFVHTTVAAPPFTSRLGPRWIISTTRARGRRGRTKPGAGGMGRLRCMGRAAIWPTRRPRPLRSTTCHGAAAKGQPQPTELRDLGQGTRLTWPASACPPKTAPKSHGFFLGTWALKRAKNSHWKLRNRAHVRA